MPRILIITHTRSEGTLVDGTRRGDGASDVLKRHGWRWGRSIAQWYVPHSRDVPAKTTTIAATADALRAAGFGVEVTIDDTARDTTDVEADRAARQADRVDALEAKATRRHDAAAAAEERMNRAHDALPPGGEPIKVGHHSERRHRRAIQKAFDTLDRYVEASASAAEADRRAESAAHTTDRRFDPGFTARRIQKLEAEIRAHRRELDGYTRTLFVHPTTGQKHVEVRQPATGQRRVDLAARIAEKSDQVAFWRAQIDRAKAGGALVLTSSMVRVGDRVFAVGQWSRVVKVNSKSVTVPHWFIDGHTTTVAYDKITAIRDTDGAAVTFTDGVRHDSPGKAG